MTARSESHTLKPGESHVFRRTWSSLDLIGFSVHGDCFVEQLLVGGEPRPVRTFGVNAYELGASAPMAEIEATVRSFARGVSTASIVWLEAADVQPATEEAREQIMVTPRGGVYETDTPHEAARRAVYPTLTRKQSATTSPMGTVAGADHQGVTRHVQAFTSPEASSTGGAIQQAQFSAGQVGECYGMPSPEIREIPAAPETRYVGQLTESMTQSGGWSQVTAPPGHVDCWTTRPSDTAEVPTLADMLAVVMTTTTKRDLDAWMNDGVLLSSDSKKRVLVALRAALEATSPSFPGSALRLPRDRAQALLDEISETPSVEELEK